MIQVSINLSRVSLRNNHRILSLNNGMHREAFHFFPPYLTDRLLRFNVSVKVECNESGLELLRSIVYQPY